MSKIREKLEIVENDIKANRERAKAQSMNRRVDVGIAIEVRVLIPGPNGKGALMVRSEETAVAADPTDLETMVTVLRGSLINASMGLPDAMVYGDDNAIYSVDMRCPKCRKAKRSAVKKSGKGR